jgi:threonine/homoserine/homoserine lactone efflux protein
MTAEQALSFFLFAVAAAGTPGPSNALLTATGAAVGVRRGLPCLLGVGLGMGLMMFVVAFGLGRAILHDPRLLEAVKWCGAAMLLWLAVRIATAGRGGAGAASGPPVGFVGAAAFQWVNPKAWLVCASAAATFLQAGSDGALTQSAAFALVFVAAAVPSGLPWLAFGAVLHRWLRDDRARRTFNVIMGALLAASVVLIIW